MDQKIKYMNIENMYIDDIQDYLCNAEAYNMFKEKDYKFLYLL